MDFVIIRIVDTPGVKALAERGASDPPLADLKQKCKTCTFSNQNKRTNAAGEIHAALKLFHKRREAMSNHLQEAKCEECGRIFFLGITGITTDAGRDICDQCSYTIRSKTNGFIINDPWKSMEVEDELTDMEKA